MNLSSIQLPKFSFRNLRKRFYIFVIPILLFQNCYLNPFVYDLLNPNIDEENKSGFLLGLSGLSSSIYVTGIIRNGSGVAQVNKEYTVVSSDGNVFGVDSSGTTDKSGRFYVSIGQGDTKISVTELGEALVTFTINVSGPMIQLKTVDPVSYEIESLFMYSPGNKPVSFDLVSTSPANNESYFGFNPNLTLTFSDAIPEWDFSTLSNLVTNNIMVSPASMSIMSPSLSPPNTIILMTNVSVYSTEYTVQIGPGFYSATNVPLTPRSVKFTLLTPP